jgi:hypothetical protein
MNYIIDLNTPVPESVVTDEGSPTPIAPLTEDQDNN